MKKNTGSRLLKNKNLIFEPLKTHVPKTENSQYRTDFDAHKCALIPLLGFEGGNNCQSNGNKIKILQKPSKNPLKHQSQFQPKRVRDFTSCRF